MTRPHPYHPPLPQPAALIRVDTCDTRSHTFRETRTATAQHLRGRRWLHTSATANSSLLTANWTFTYDNLYRLDNATGWWEYRPLHLTLHDTVNMRYSKNGRIIRKQEYAETFKNSLLNLVRYDRQYQYSSPYSNKLGSVTGVMPGANHQFGWDGCGNMVRHDNPEQGCDRRLSWTEDNRLQFVKDNGSTGAYYQYDAGGDRTYKLLYHKTTGSLNGVQTDYYTLDDATLYVSPYLVVTPQGYTKHYYAESERITTQLGKYRFAVVDSCVAGDSLASVKLQNAVQAFPMDSFPTPAPMFGYLHSLVSKPKAVSTLYFYHPDHLGSASWITNIYGRTIQHLYYLPWGEDFVNQRTGSFSSMYTFSAKEKDTETGYSYFGSRYYSSDLSVWLSVDPMAAKYPSLSPYVYCANNPIKLVDIDGNDWVKVNSQWQWNGNIHNKEQAIKAGYDDYLPCRSIVDNASIDGQFGRNGKTSVYLGDSENDVFFTYPNKTVTPWQVGREWLTGQGPRERNFKAGDYFTELLRDHRHIKDLLTDLSQKLRVGSVKIGASNSMNYDLSGIQGVGKYLKDYSTLLTFGEFGNLAVTYLGSYNLTWKILQIDGNTATIGITVSNSSTMQSATRPPVLGYTGLWKNTIGNAINKWFDSGPGSTTEQNFNWTETITF